MAKPGRWVDNNLPHLIGSVLLLVAIAAPIGQFGAGAHMFIKEALAECWILALAIMYLWAVRGRELRYTLDPLAIVLVLLLCWCGLSLLWSSKPDYGVVTFMRWGAASILAVLTFQIRDRREVNTVLKYVFVSGFVVALIGCLQHLFDFDLFPQAIRPASTFANRNMAVQIVILCWLSGPWLLWQLTSRDSMAQYFCAVGTAIMLTFVVYTQTRAAWVSIAVQIVAIAICFAVLRVRRPQTLVARNIGIAPVVVSVLVLATMSNFSSKGFTPVWKSVGDRLGSIVTDAGQTEGATAYDRFVIWRSTLDIAREHPVFGAGLGSFDHLHQRYAVGDTLTIHYSHNDYLQTAAEMGAVGGILVLAVLGLLVTAGFRLLLGELHTVELTAMAVLLAIGGIAVDAVFSFPFQLIGPMVFVAVLVGLLLRLVAEERALRFQGLWQAASATLVVPAAIVVFALNIEFWLKLEELSVETRAGKWDTPVDLDTTIHHPIFRRFVRVIAQRYQLDEPSKAEMAARSYYDIDDQDVVVNNALAVSLIYQQRYREAEELIAATRQLEPRGYYRSWENEMILGNETRDFDRLRGALDALSAEPRELLLAEPKTYINMATTAFNIGESQRALELVNELIATYPGDLQAKKLRDEIERRLSRQ